MVHPSQSRPRRHCRQNCSEHACHACDLRRVKTLAGGAQTARDGFGDTRDGGVSEWEVSFSDNHRKRKDGVYFFSSLESWNCSVDSRSQATGSLSVVFGLEMFGKHLDLVD